MIFLLKPEYICESVDNFQVACLIFSFEEFFFTNLAFSLFEVFWDPNDFTNISIFWKFCGSYKWFVLQINWLVSAIFHSLNILNLFSPMMHVLIAFLPNFKSDRVWTSLNEWKSSLIRFDQFETIILLMLLTRNVFIFCHFSLNKIRWISQLLFNHTRFI